MSFSSDRDRVALEGTAQTRMKISISGKVVMAEMLYLLWVRNVDLINNSSTVKTDFLTKNSGW